MEKIKYSKKILKSLSSLPVAIIEKFGEKEKMFRENPFYPTLKNNKLSGREKRISGFLDKLFLLYKICLP